MDEVVAAYGTNSLNEFRRRYQNAIEDHIIRGRLSREGQWTENIAVGSEAFVRRIEEETRNRRVLTVSDSEDGQWLLREEITPYN